MFSHMSVNAAVLFPTFTLYATVALKCKTQSATVNYKIQHQRKVGTLLIGQPHCLSFFLTFPSPGTKKAGQCVRPFSDNPCRLPVPSAKPKTQ